MDDRSRYVVGGAILGAMLGALLGWGLARHFGVKTTKSGGEDVAATGSSLDMRRIFRLGLGVVGIVRQLLELE